MEANSTSAVESMETEVPMVSYNSTDLFVFNEIHKQKSGDPIPIDAELKTYVDIYFEQITNNWTEDRHNH